MEEIAVIIQTEIKSTESEEKVNRSIMNIFGDINKKVDLKTRSKTLKCKLKGRESLFRFREILKLDRIRDASKKVLSKCITGNKIVFFLNKQVASINHVSFSEEISESPLGPIRIEIFCENPKSLINWLTSKEAQSGD